MTLKHTNPSGPRRDRDGHTFQAHAPYNFVPLPESMVPATAKLPDHDVYEEELLTGRIECELKTHSPIYVRGMLTPDDFREFGEKKPDKITVPEKRKRAPFFSTAESQIEGKGQPRIPGSSLRGMVRSVIEIIGFGRMRWVGKKPTFTFRAVAASRDDPLREPYRQALGPFGRNVRAGYLVQRGDIWYIQPALTPKQVGWPSDDAYLKVKARNINGRDLPEYIQLDDPKYRPQIHHVRFDVDVRRNQRGAYPAVTQLAARKGSSLRYDGFLVCSGNMKEVSKNKPTQRSPRKKHALVLMPDEKARTLKIPQQVVDDYKAGLSSYQKSEALTDWSGDRFAEMGCLGDLKPVFYVAQGHEVIYFGHSPNFRIPAKLDGANRAATPPDFVPDALRNDPQPDLADAIFGWVEDESSPSAQRAGRVFFEDAKYVDAEDDVWLSRRGDPIIPHTLSGPKATTFQHYLVQDRNEGHSPDRKDTLAHYGSSSSSTQIRGHKRYWHRGGSPDIEASATEREHEKQLTRIIPVKPGVRFKFIVHFENLRTEELGALWWALALPGGPGKIYRHKLGMGKPLGMGAVELTPQLFLSDRCGTDGRYARLFDDGGWHRAERHADAAPYTKQFEAYVLQQAGLPGAKRLADVERIRMLLAMLEWREGTRAWLEKTSYMEIKAGAAEVNEYKERPVLPDPLTVSAEYVPGDAALSTHSEQTEQGASRTEDAVQVTGADDNVRVGTVKRWIDDRTYGFITPDGGGRDVFVHISGVWGKQALQEGQRVQYEAVQGPKGLQARNVRSLQ